MHSPSPERSPPGRVLIADDEQVFARPLAELFRREGFEAEAVFDSPSVFTTLQHTAFDVLISDINMPGNPGLELVQTLAVQERRIPVILLTGSPSISTAARAVQLGAVAYLLKPVDFDELLPVVEKAIEQHRVAQLARDQRHHLERWIAELHALENATASATEGATTRDFIGVTVSNLTAALAQFRRASELVHAGRRAPSATWHANTLHALTKSVDVLERTRRNFKSTELRDLRHELQTLVDTFPRSAQ